MPALARDFEVIAVDQRGIGRSGNPRGGYDTGTLGRNLAALMDALGHKRFAVVGHDTGHFISYALAADHPDRVDRVALLEVPGPPGATPSPPLFLPEPINNKVWHIPFNRVDKVPEQLIRGRQDIYFGYEFAIQAGKKLPEEVVNYYAGLVSNRESLRGSLAFYRAWDATVAQNQQRKNRPLAMPVLAIGGAASWGELVGNEMKLLATNVQSVVIPGTGHWVAEESAGGADPVPRAVPGRVGRGAQGPAPCRRGVAVAWLDDRVRRLRMPSLGGATEWLNSEHITFAPFSAPDHMSVLGVDPERVSIQTSAGRDWCTESMVREHAREELPT